MNDQPGTREELRRQLEEAGLGPNQTRVWLDSPTPYLSGLVPAEAIADPTTAARARYAVRRLIARLGDPVPDGVTVTEATIRQPDTYLVDLSFAWPGGTARRLIDMEPYLAASRAHESMLGDHEDFGSLRVGADGISWTNHPAFSATLLFAESWPDEGAVAAVPGFLQGRVDAGHRTAVVAKHNEQNDQQHDAQHEQERVRQDDVRRGSSTEQRRRWRQRATWLSQLGLAPEDDVPVEAVEEVADAVVALLDELERVELRLANSRTPPVQPPTR
jgi:hypothetical protein